MKTFLMIMLVTASAIANESNSNNSKEPVLSSIEILESNTNKAKTKRPLTNEEISLFFIGFEEQARQEIKREKETEKENTHKEKSHKKIHANSERGVLSHDGEARSVDENQFKTTAQNMTMFPNLKNKRIVKTSEELKVYGIVCEKERCQAFTNKGILIKGSVIDNNEKIEKIEKNTISTNFKKIKL